ncbi:hypothetical protein Dimus_018595, partial [Dionaea muscipula]
AAPREVLAVVKESDNSNTTNIKSIYNFLYTEKVEGRAGLSPVHWMLSELRKHNYQHDMLTDPDTHE